MPPGAPSEQHWERAPAESSDRWLPLDSVYLSAKDQLGFFDFQSYRWAALRPGHEVQRLLYPPPDLKAGRSRHGERYPRLYLFRPRSDMPGPRQIRNQSGPAGDAFQDRQQRVGALPSRSRHAHTSSRHHEARENRDTFARNLQA